MKETKDEIYFKYKSTPMFNKIIINDNLKKNIFSDEDNAIKATIETTIETMVLKVQQRIDEVLLKDLYEIYRNTNISSLIVIDEVQFKEFLNKYLPIWFKEFL